MRIVTWNCNASASIKSQPVATARFHRTLETVAHLQASVLVLQEVPNPGEARPDDCWAFWHGSMLGRGIAVILSRSEFPEARRVGQTRSSLLVHAEAPHQFNILAIWSCPEGKSLQHYLLETRAALEEHAAQVRQHPTVIVGDFNSSAAWDHQARKFSHTALTQMLETELALVSAYHKHHGLRAGEERHATFHHYRRQDKPFHIDYCFLPKAWTVNEVTVGDYADWTAHSDHCPLIVDCQPGAHDAG